MRWFLEETLQTKIQNLKDLIDEDFVLSRSNLTEIPQELISSSVIIRRLDVSENSISQIPAQLIINNINYLTELYLDYNKLTSLPKELLFLQKLCILSVCYNNLSELPANIGKLQTLQSIRMSGNPRFQEIPYSIVLLENLLEFRHDDISFRIPIESISTSANPSNTLLSSSAENSKSPSELLSSIPPSHLRVVASVYRYLTVLRPFNVIFSQTSHLKRKTDASECTLCRNPFTNLSRKVITILLFIIEKGTDFFLPL